MILDASVVVVGTHGWKIFLKRGARGSIFDGLFVDRIVSETFGNT